MSTAAESDNTITPNSFLIERVYEELTLPKEWEDDWLDYYNTEIENIIGHEEYEKYRDSKFSDSNTPLNFEFCIVNNCNPETFPDRYSKMVEVISKFNSIPLFVANLYLGQILFKHNILPPSSSAAELYVMTKTYSELIQRKYSFQFYVPGNVEPSDVIHITKLFNHSFDVDLSTILMINPATWVITNVIDSNDFLSCNSSFFDQYGKSDHVYSLFSSRYSDLSYDIRRSIPVSYIRSVWLGMKCCQHKIFCDQFWNSVCEFISRLDTISQRRIIHQIVMDIIARKPKPLIHNSDRISHATIIKYFIKKNIDYFLKFPFDIRRCQNLTIDIEDCLGYVLFVKNKIIKSDQLLEFIESQLAINPSRALDFVKPFVKTNILRTDFYFRILAKIYHISSETEKCKALKDYSSSIAVHLPGIDNPNSMTFKIFHQICEQGIKYDYQSLNSFTLSSQASEYYLHTMMQTINNTGFIGPHERPSEFIDSDDLPE
jgi:hypothetical protein